MKKLSNRKLNSMKKHRKQMPLRVETKRQRNPSRVVAMRSLQKNQFMAEWNFGVFPMSTVMFRDSGYTDFIEKAVTFGSNLLLDELTTRAWMSRIIKLSEMPLQWNNAKLPTAGELKLTDTILNLTYFTGALAILSIIVGEIIKAVRSKK